jgi:vacuolar-type H+-ATPase subunit I/STV1
LKKVTIVTSTEHESLLLDQLGKARLISFKTVPQSEYEGFEESFTERINFSAVYKELGNQYEKLIKSEPSLRVRPQTPDDEELKQFAKNPEAMTRRIIDEIAELRKIVEEKKLLIEHVEEQRDLKIEKVKKELEEKKAQLRSNYENEANKSQEQIEQLELQLYSLRIQAKPLQVLTSDELKKCSAAGVVKKEVTNEIEKFLQSLSKGSFKSYEISDSENLLFFFGIDDDQKLIDFLFLVYEVVDIYDAFKSGDLLLVLDPKRLEMRIKEYEAKIVETRKEIEEAKKREKNQDEIEAEILKLNEEYAKPIEDIRGKYYSSEKEKQEQYASEISVLKQEWLERLAKIHYYEGYLRNYSSDAPILRNEVLCIMQGWVPNDMMDNFEEIMDSLENDFGEKPYYRVEDPKPGEIHIPTPQPKMPAIIRNTWILTRLRGWPSLEELNPAYISIFIFCFQFGLMFGDIGQGAIYLIIGLALFSRFKRGMMKYLTAVFIPMGTAAIIFGFMYDSIFLNEDLISHTLHELGVELPFAYPIMPNPIHDTPNLLNLIFLVGAFEVVFGSILGALNALKRGDYVAIIGEHGLGMGMYVLGLYLSMGNMFTEGLDVVSMLGNWTFKIALLGLVMATAEPILHSVRHGHGLGIEAMGEAVSAFLMVFIEGLANMFSFLRLAAFALAHAALGGAAISMGAAIGSQIGALAIMNVIALSFEFVSSSVQSLRLLYYEFMAKFFHGEGVPFKPFKLGATPTIVE